MGMLAFHHGPGLFRVQTNAICHESTKSRNKQTQMSFVIR
jgi:hypothetical protein